MRVKVFKNNQGSTLLELLVVTGAMVSTGITAAMLYRQFTQGVGATAGKLALYETVSAIEKRLVRSCMATLFDAPGDHDRHLALAGLSKPRVAIDGLRTGMSIQVSNARVTVDGLSLKTERYVGRDIALATLTVQASVTGGGELAQSTFTDKLPFFVRVSNFDTDPTAVDCTAVTNDQPLEGMVYLGSSGILADITNHSEVFNFITCMNLAPFGAGNCANGNALWGVNTTTGIPLGTPATTSTSGTTTTSTVPLSSILNPTLDVRTISEMTHFSGDGFTGTNSEVGPSPGL